MLDISEHVGERERRFSEAQDSSLWQAVHKTHVNSWNILRPSNWDSCQVGILSKSNTTFNVFSCFSYMSKGYHTWIPFALKSSKSSEVFCRCGWPFIELKVAESCGTDLSPGNIQAGQIFEKRYPGHQIDRRWPKSTIDFNLPPTKSDSEELYIFSIMFSIPSSLKAT